MMTEQPLVWLRDEIRSTLADWCEEKESENYWRDPLVAVAAANDPQFGELRRVVDPDHAMPGDILPGARSVIVFFLPFQQWLGRENDRGRVLRGAQLGRKLHRYKPAHPNHQ